MYVIYYLVDGGEGEGDGGISRTVVNCNSARLSVCQCGAGVFTKACMPKGWIDKRSRAAL